MVFSVWLRQPRDLEVSHCQPLQPEPLSPKEEEEEGVQAGWL